MSDSISRAEVHKTLSLLATEGGKDAKMLLSDAHEFIDALPSAEAEQVTGKLKNHCDSLLKSDSDECKEQKSKLDLISRADALGELNGACSNWEDDAKVAEIINALPSAETSQNLTKPNKELKGSDLISRADAIEAVEHIMRRDKLYLPLNYKERRKALVNAITMIKKCPSADAVSREDYHNLLTATEDIDRALREYQAKDEKPSADAKHNHGDGQWYDLTDALTVERNEWIPCSERLPKEKQEVYVTVYFIEGDTGRAYGYMDGFGRWHLYSTVEGTLNSGYEVTAWMPLPKPYREDGEE